MQITLGKNVYTLENSDKVRRVIEGEMNGRRVVFKGLGVNAKPEDVITEYDKRAGLITGKDGAAVKTGCFWDVVNNRPQVKPEIVYTIRVNGQVVEIPEGKELPMQVQAAVVAEKTKKRK